MTTNDKDSVPYIDLKTNSDETTITHEVLHHLRTVDKDRSGYAKTAYPVDSKGISKAKKYMGKSIHDNISNSEETATAAETEIRTRTPGHVSMYWNLDKHSISGKETRDHDRAVMRSNGAVKEGDNATGKKAVKMMNENYPKTQVQSKKVGGESALDTFKKIFHLRSKHKW